MQKLKSIVGRLLVSCLFAFCLMLNLQAQTNIIIQAPIVAGDHTVKISWNAEAGAVYQIESADSLTDAGSQGLQWIIRETDCASKGTNAEWMDVGDSQWIPRILSPRFQPVRFLPRHQSETSDVDAAANCHAAT